MARVDFRKRLTDRLIAFLDENDGMPWQKGWNAVNVRPFNPGTGVKYRGGNVLNLINGALERGSDDSRWMTLKQANAKGYSVRKGAKGELVEYWDWGQAKAAPARELDADGKPVAAGHAQGVAGDDEVGGGRARKPIVFYAVVFNGADIHGLPEMKRDVSWQPNDLAEKLIAAIGARIEHKALSKTAGGRTMANAAYFDNAADAIVMPLRSSFKSDGDYYATVLHELAHWTGHVTRMDRLSSDIKFGTPEYAKEELRAEIAAMFLTSMLGMEGNVQNHARYAASWIEVLKKDKHELFRAAKDAEGIVDHIFEYAPELKAMLDKRFEDNLLKMNPARVRENSLGELPNFRPANAPGPAAEAGVGRDDPRWPGFEKAVRGEAQKYGILVATVERTLELMEPMFSDVMTAAKKNGYTVDDMHEMLLKQLMDDLRENNEREKQWLKFCEQVRAAATDLMPPENVELRLQQMSTEYQRILQIAAQDEWKQEVTDQAVREMIFGQGGRRPITPEYIKEQFMVSGSPFADLDDDSPLTLTGAGLALGDASTEAARPHDDDDDLLLTPPGGGMSLGDAMPADASAMPDERVGSSRASHVEPEIDHSPSP